MPDDRGLAAVMDWLDGMKRGDAAAVARCFRPDVRWTGVPADARCESRDEVMELLGGTFGRSVRAEALELIAGEDAIVLGVRSPDLREIGDVALPGQLYNVFAARDGLIASVTDFVHRDEA